MTATVDHKPRDCYTRDGDPKVRFESKRAAKRVARIVPHDDPHVYRCPYCHTWHIGNRP